MEFNAQITKLVNGNTYEQIEISLNTYRNTPDFMCDLEPFSKIRSHKYYRKAIDIRSYLLRSC